MSSSYTTEPPPTATVLLHTTAGPLTLSLFAQQTPLTCRNFLQHCLDGYYSKCTFHRISPGFVIQTGDPTSTGEGGENIYEQDAENECLDEKWARVLGKEKGERIVFGDEIHSRLKFNRRGLVGMAKGEGKGAAYGSQFFVTLGDCRQELDGKCTMFGRVEGDGIYNVVKVAEGELVEGTERPIYPEKILSTEIVDMPKGEAWDSMRRRERTAIRQTVGLVKKKEKPKKKAGKQMLSFDDGEESGDVPVRPKKAKFNTALIEAREGDERPLINSKSKAEKPPPTRGKSPSPPPQQSIPAKRKADSVDRTPSPNHHRKPSFHDSTTQLPLRNDESPSRSQSSSQSPLPRRKSSASKSKSALEAEIAALKQSMRRTSPTRTESNYKKSALEAMIPETATRGRKRPRPGDNMATSKADAGALKMLNAFRARLDKADHADEAPSVSKGKSTANGSKTNGTKDEAPFADDEEAQVCDLHFIANCQSCSNWNDADMHNQEDDEDERAFLSHALKFGKDMLGKDLDWKKKDRNRDFDDGLMVIDPREKEREIKSKGRGKERDRW